MLSCIYLKKSLQICQSYKFFKRELTLRSLIPFEHDENGQNKLLD